MARVCDYCGKGVFTGNKVSHSNIKTRTRWYPNLKAVKAVVKGATVTVKACTRCIRSGKIVRPLKRTYKPEAATQTTAKAAPKTATKRATKTAPTTAAKA